MLRKRYFRTEFYEEVRSFLHSIDSKAADKILWNIDLAEQTNDPRLFKKLQDDIWEFRTKYNNQQYRLFAFWDKTQKENTLVFATHGIIKKVEKISLKEIEKTKEIRKEYFKRNKNGNKK